MFQENKKSHASPWHWWLAARFWIWWSPPSGQPQRQQWQTMCSMELVPTWSDLWFFAKIVLQFKKNSSPSFKLRWYPLKAGVFSNAPRSKCSKRNSELLPEALPVAQGFRSSASPGGWILGKKMMGCWTMRCQWKNDGWMLNANGID